MSCLLVGGEDRSLSIHHFMSGTRLNGVFKVLVPGRIMTKSCRIKRSVHILGGIDEID